MSANTDRPTRPAWVVPAVILGVTALLVALVIFSDYQCPFCATWSADTLPVMTERAEAGELRIEWRDVNVFGDASERASLASYAAALQGAFWEYHDELFANGDTRSERALSEDALDQALADAG